MHANKAKSTTQQFYIYNTFNVAPSQILRTVIEDYQDLFLLQKQQTIKKITPLRTFALICGKKSQ
jgi:hypothetical protein